MRRPFSTEIDLPGEGDGKFLQETRVSVEGNEAFLQKLMFPAKETASFQNKLWSPLKKVTISIEIDVPGKGDGSFLQKTMISVEGSDAFYRN